MTRDAGDGFVVEKITASSERLRVDESAGNISRNGALFVRTSSDPFGNTFVGKYAGSTSTKGTRNSVFRNSTRRFNTSGTSKSPQRKS